MLGVMEEGVRRIRVCYRGRVQGVGFRATARSIAAQHPVSGWVRNESDGSVVLEVQGEGQSLERFLGELRQSMTGLIEREDSDPVTVVGAERGFSITF